MKIIKSAIVFKAHLPESQADLANHLLEMPHAPLTTEQFYRTSFVPSYHTGELVTPIHGGFAITVRHDEKIMPNGAVNSAKNAAVEAKEAELGRRLSDEEAKAIHEMVCGELLKTALISTTIVNAFYSAEEKLLIIPASKKMAQSVVAALIQGFGSIKTETIHISDIKHGLTTRLQNHMEMIPHLSEGEEYNAFGDFKLGQSVNLKLKKDKLNLVMSDIDDARRGVNEALEHGFLVDRIELVHKEMSFKLTNDFHFKGIDYFGLLTEDEQLSRSDMDIPQLWIAEAGVQMMQLTAAILALCSMFDYQPKIADEKQLDLVDHIEKVGELA